MIPTNSGPLKGFYYPLSTPIKPVSHQSYDRLAVRFSADFARMSQVWPCVSRENSIGSRTLRSILEAVVQKQQGYCTVISQQSSDICGRNMWVRALTLFGRPSCVSCSSIACLAAVLRPHKIAQESQGKWTCRKFSFCRCDSLAYL